MIPHFLRNQLFNLDQNSGCILLCTPIFILTNIYLLPWHLFCSLSCLDTLIVWCIYKYIDVQALVIK